MRLELPKWYDLHVHFRQGAAMRAYVEAHIRMGCAGVLAMPNTRPPVKRVRGPEGEGAWSIEDYRRMIEEAGGERFERILVPLYLTADTTVEMVEEGVRSGLLGACKYYPPHGTTNAEHGVGMEEWTGSAVFRAMEELGVVLCVHGEEHGLMGERYFGARENAETVFYRERMPRLLEAHPRLKVVCEHITTREAVEFVRSAPGTVGATVTPQHLLFTVGDLIRGFRHPLYCLPVVKFEEDRAALREAVTEPGQERFFAGTDSAPHAVKVTECGCAAGCFTGGCAPQLYAMGFEDSGCELGGEEGREVFRRFLCENGAGFYGWPVSRERFAMVREAGSCEPLATGEGTVVPLPVGMGMELSWRMEEGG